MGWLQMFLHTSGPAHLKSFLASLKVRIRRVEAETRKLEQALVVMSKPGRDLRRDILLEAGAWPLAA
jgi:hypothetical protein